MLAVLGTYLHLRGSPLSSGRRAHIPPPMLSRSPEPHSSQDPTTTSTSPFLCARTAPPAILVLFCAVRPEMPPAIGTSKLPKANLASAAFPAGHQLSLSRFAPAVAGSRLPTMSLSAREIVLGQSALFVQT